MAPSDSDEISPSASSEGAGDSIGSNDSLGLRSSYYDQFDSSWHLGESESDYLLSIPPSQDSVQPLGADDGVSER